MRQTTSIFVAQVFFELIGGLGLSLGFTTLYGLHSLTRGYG